MKLIIRNKGFNHPGYGTTNLIYKMNDTIIGLYFNLITCKTIIILDFIQIYHNL